MFCKLLNRSSHPTLLGSTMLQTAITREVGRSRYVEFATMEATSVKRTQIEFRDGKIFMRTKKRVYVFS